MLRQKIISIAVLMGLCFAALVWLSRPSAWPVHVIAVESAFHHVTRDQLSSPLYKAALADGWLRYPASSLSQQLGQLPWVKRVSVGRHWPDEIWVKMVERQPVARFGQSALIDAQGIVFQPKRLPKSAQALPQLWGRRGVAPEAVLKKFEALKATVSPLKWTLRRYDQRQPGQEQFENTNGLTVTWCLDKNLMSVAQFVSLYPKQFQGHGLVLANLCYPHGVAVS